jgi:hypothetical protein
VIERLGKLIFIGFSCALLCAGLIAFGDFSLVGRSRPTCTEALIHAESDLRESDKELMLISERGSKDKCDIYRKRFALLTKHRTTFEVCGPLQATKRAAWPVPHAELSFYGRLVEKCT